MVLEQTQKRKNPKKWFVIPVILILVFIVIDNTFFTEYYSSGPPLPPTLPENASDVETQEYTEKIQDLENLLSSVMEEKEQLRIYQELSINSQKRASALLQRYALGVDIPLSEPLREKRKYITPDSEGVTQLNKKIPEGNYLLNAYNYIIENFYYYYDPFTRTTEGTQEWTNIKAYDLKNEKWIEIKLRDSVVLHDFPDIIFYPDETIEFGGGDCEDFAVLYTSMAINKGQSGHFYIVDIDKDGMQFLHAISIINGRVLVDIPSKLYISGRNVDDIFDKYVDALNANKVTIIGIFNHEEFSNIRKTYS